jgi:segregation and condensation protein B
MEENIDQEQQLPEQKVEVKTEQYNKPKDVHLPLPGSLQEIVGALLFASESPLSAAELRECVRGVSPEDGDSAEIMEVYKTCTNREIEEALRGLEKALEVAKCGFSLVCTGGQYRMQTTPVCGRYVRALLKLDRPNRLSRASLETLAIVAYRQPITKSEVEQIRGVSVDTIMKTLADLGLVRLVSRSELPGHPFLYGTTPFFLEHFGLASLDQLNEIDPTLPRSNPRERAKLFKKEEKPTAQTELSAAAEEAAQAKVEETQKQQSEAVVEPSETETSEGEDEDRAKIVYESFEDDLEDEEQSDFDEDDQDGDDDFDEDGDDDDFDGEDEEFDDDDDEDEDDGDEDDEDDEFDDDEDEFEDDDEFDDDEEDEEDEDEV